MHFGATRPPALFALLLGLCGGCLTESGRIGALADLPGEDPHTPAVDNGIVADPDTLSGFVDMVTPPDEGPPDIPSAPVDTASPPDAGPTVTAPLCQPCSSPDDCGGAGWLCLPVGAAQACLPPCSTSDDCPTGWFCFTSGGPARCAPANLQCSGCAVDGCPEGLVCDTNLGVCMGGVELCGECTYDWQCGPQASCARLSATSPMRYCVPRCSGGVACPGASTCEVAPDSEVQVCIPNGGPCCFDPDPSQCPADCSPPCSGATPFCLYGSCVECLTDDHCPDGSCHTASYTCQSDFCATCVDPYPACAMVAGEWYCVQCTDDSHCGPGGACDPQTLSCSGVMPTECLTDADCSGGGIGPDLACDVSSGACYAPNGACDNVTAFCVGEDSQCVPTTSLFEEQFPFPPLPSLDGFCSCDPGLYNCPDGVTCLPVAGFAELLDVKLAPGASGDYCFPLGP